MAAAVYIQRMPTPLFPIRLGDDDRALLEAIAKAEKAPKSSIIRRLIRKEAKRLGIQTSGRRARR